MIGTNIKRLYGGNANEGILTFTAEQDNSTIKLFSIGLPTLISLEYNVNDTRWRSYTFTDVEEEGVAVSRDGETITLTNTGDFVRLKAKPSNKFLWTQWQNNDKQVYEEPISYYQFLITGSIAASGDIMQLIGSKRTYSGCFYSLFKNCTGLRSYEDNPLILSATDLRNAHKQYQSMFEGCTGIEYVELPSEIIVGNAAAKGFASMFKGCTSLKKCNNILFTIDNYVRQVSFAEMFSDCTSLEEIPLFTVKGGNSSAALVVGDDTYYKMFKGCTSLVDAGDFTIYGPNASVYCKNDSIFEGCTSLEHSPILNRVIFDYNSVYGSMANFFKGCSSLKDIVYYKNFWPNRESFGANTVHTYNWINGVPATGDFFCPATLPKIRSNHHIPLGWDVHDIDSRPLCFEAEEAGKSIQLRKVGEPDEIPFEYSTDGTNWQKYDFSYISLPNIGDKVYFRCSENSNKYKSTYKGSGSYYRFYRSAGTFKVSGNLFTLLKMNGAKIFTATSSDKAFVSLFSSAGITSMPTLPDYGVYGDRALLYIFYGNANLVNKSVELKFRNAKFWGKAFYYTFSRARISEVTVDILEALFIGVSSATPFDHTFENCSNLQKIKVRFSNWVLPNKPTTNKCSGWVEGVAENGVFVCPKTLEEIHDINHIPVGWTVVHWIDEMKTQYPDIIPLCEEYPAIEDVIDAHPDITPKLLEYPNLVHSLIETNKRPYMETRGDKWTTDIYPHEQMTGKVRYYRTNFRDSFSYGSSIENLNNLQGYFFICSASDASSYSIRMLVGDVTGNKYGQTVGNSLGEHEIEWSTSGIKFDDTLIPKKDAINWNNFYTRSENLTMYHVAPICINDYTTIYLNDSKMYYFILEENGVVTHKFVPVTDRIIADIADLDDIKIYEGEIAGDTYNEQRPSVFGLEDL